MVDAIGADRGLDNEVGEARRILNSFLQFLEQDESESVIVAATNNQRLLDQALFIFVDKRISKNGNLDCIIAYSYNLSMA